jgi:hypothetical protein
MAAGKSLAPTARFKAVSVRTLRIGTDVQTLSVSATVSCHSHYSDNGGCYQWGTRGPSPGGAGIMSRGPCCLQRLLFGS